jgi:hypothetical protein
MPNIGDRVGAICNQEGRTFYFFGYGKYEGEIIPRQEDGVYFLGEPMLKPNPCILLDNGKRVYGCECWWGSETQIKMTMKGATVVEVDIEQLRKENRPSAN